MFNELVRSGGRDEVVVVKGRWDVDADAEPDLQGERKRYQGSTNDSSRRTDDSLGIVECLI